MGIFTSTTWNARNKLFTSKIQWWDRHHMPVIDVWFKRGEKRRKRGVILSPWKIHIFLLPQTPTNRLWATRSCDRCTSVTRLDSATSPFLVLLWLWPSDTQMQQRNPLLPFLVSSLLTPNKSTRSQRLTLSGSPPAWMSLLLWYFFPCCPLLRVCDSLSLGPESIINCFFWASLLSPFVATPYCPLKEHSIHRSQTISKSLVVLHSALCV